MDSGPHPPLSGSLSVGSGFPPRFDGSYNPDEVIARLMNELRQYRETEEEILRLVRLRAPSLEGLTLVGAVKGLMDTRDSLLGDTQEAKQFLKTVADGIRDGKPVYPLIVEKLHKR